MTSAPAAQGRELGHTCAGTAAPQGEQWAIPRARGVYQRDTMSKDEGARFLLGKTRLLEADQRRRHFLEDLPDQKEFSWSYLVAGLRGGQEVLQAGVELGAAFGGSESKRPGAICIREARGRESVILLITKAAWNDAAVAEINWR